MDRSQGRGFDRDRNQSPGSSVGMTEMDPIPVSIPRPSTPISNASGPPGILASDKNLFFPLEESAFAAIPPVTPGPVESPWAPPPPVAAMPPVEMDVAGRMSPSRYPLPDSPQLRPTRESLACSTAAASHCDPKAQPKLPQVLVTPPAISCHCARSMSETSLPSSDQHAQQDRQQLPQHNSRYTAGPTQTPHSPRTPEKLPLRSPHHHHHPHPHPHPNPHSQVSGPAIFAAGVTEAPPPTESSTPGSPPPQQPAPSAHSETNPATPRAPSPQQPPGPPVAPFQPPLYQPSYIGWATLPTMAQAVFCATPPYWYCYPGAAPGASYPYFTWNKQSPWYSGTSHHLTNPPPPPPQIYTVEPAYIMPQQATYYQAAPQATGAYYYYMPGIPTYYHT